MGAIKRASHPALAFDLQRSFRQNAAQTYTLLDTTEVIA